MLRCEIRPPNCKLAINAMNNFTPKSSPKEIREITVHISTHTVCKPFRAQSCVSHSAEVKNRSGEVGAFLPALVSWGFPHTLNEYFTSGICSIPQQETRLSSAEGTEPRNH